MRRIKKIIAIEFLTMLLGVFIFLIGWLLWTQVNNFMKSKAGNLTNEIETLKGFEPYQSLLKYTEVANSGKYSNWEDIDLQFPQLMTFDKQALKEYVATENSKKYKNFIILNSKFPEFGFDSLGVHKNFNAKQLEELQQKQKSLKNTRDSFFYQSHSVDILLSLGIILFSILFGARYLFYMIKWSLKQLKEN